MTKSNRARLDICEEEDLPTRSRSNSGKGADCWDAVNAVSLFRVLVGSDTSRSLTRRYRRRRLDEKDKRCHGCTNDSQYEDL